ncbi:MAG: hypothetical protein AAF363_04790 [Bacteroidota bacterium]
MKGFKKLSSSKSINWIDHIIGFISVLLGVIMALALNNWNENRKENELLNAAILNIENEIIKNVEKVDSTILENERVYLAFREYIGMVDENMDVIAHEDTILKFQQKYPDLLDEDLDISLSFDLFQLSRVSWETTQRTGILSSFGFEISYELGLIYDFQTKLDRFDEDIVYEIQTFNDRREKAVQLLRLIRISLDFAKSLKEEGYPECLESIERFKEKL